MLSLLQFIFSSFWHFIGTVFLITAIGDAGAKVVGAIARHANMRRLHRSISKAADHAIDRSN